MGNSATNDKADAERAARKALKKARKAERKANEEKLAKEASDDAKNPTSGKKQKQENDKQKGDKELETQLLEVEKKRLQNLAESNKLEAEVKQLLNKAQDADKLAKRVAKALKKITEDGDSQLPSNITHDDDANSKDGKDVDAVVKDAAKSTTATEKPKPNGAPEATEKDNSGEKKKKDKKKKKKSKSEEGKAVEEQATSVKPKADKKRKHDDDAEQPVSKKEKRAKGGVKAAQVTTEQVKIQGLEGGAARQDKFLRLLGGKKAGANATKPGSMASGQGNSVRAEAAIQQQFEAGMMLKESGHKRRGLGA